MTSTLPQPTRTEALIAGEFVPAASGETFETKPLEEGRAVVDAGPDRVARGVGGRGRRFVGIVA